MIKKILKILFHRWVLATLGLLALSLIIWYVGPLVAIGRFRPFEAEWIRWTMILFWIFLYIGIEIWRALRARKKNTELVEGLAKEQAAPADQTPAGAEEVALLRKRFEDAMRILRKARLGESGDKSLRSRFAALKPKRYLYQLPWYVFIGAPGSGKTTALLNCGLRFPLADQLGQGSVQGVGGTRNCDWWFTDEAILLDTAGRYTTQESGQAADSAAWNGFLQLLKRNRPRRPLNGVLLTISVSDLLTQTPVERAAHATALRKRVAELHEQLGLRLPIYVLVTKTDLLAGFTEFFGDMGKEDRAQVWGTTFPADAPKEAPPLARFATEYAGLEKRLNDRLVDRMQQERDPQKRALVYGFPQQFSALRESLGDLLEQVFGGSRFNDAGWVRGIYFTSGTQEGSPFDRVLGSLARSFGLERKMLAPSRSSGRSFFLTHLLQDVIFAESEITGTNKKWERRRAWLHAAALTLTLAVSVGLIIAWVVSNARNRVYVADVAERVEPISKQVHDIDLNPTTDVLSLLPVLQSVRELAAASDVEGESPPMTMGFGLFQGDKLGAAAHTAYARLLEDAFLPRIALRIEQLLAANPRDNPELLYESLKAYIMLQDPRRMDADAFKAFVATDWYANLPRETTREQRAQLELHLNTLLDRGTTLVLPNTPNENLIAQARNTLNSTPPAQRIYNRLKRQGTGSDIPGFNIMDAGGPSVAVAFFRVSGKPLTEGIPGLYTRDGYYKAFSDTAGRVTKQMAEEEEWVLGVKRKTAVADAVPGGKDPTLEAVRRLYLEDYAGIWEAFIKDIRIMRPSNLQESINIAQLLSGPDTPLPRLMRAVVKEVTLLEDPTAKDITDKVSDSLKSKREEMLRFIGDQNAPGGAKSGPPELIVDNRFSALRTMVKSPTAGAPAPVDQVGPLMNELYTYLIGVDQAQKQRLAPPPSEVPNKMKAEAMRLPDPIRGVLTDVSDVAMQGIQGETRTILSQKLATAITPFCNSAINGRYPFVKSSDRDVTQDDFARLFAPGGLIDDFVQRELQPYVDTSTRPWKFRQTGAASGGESSAGLLQLQRAQDIRDAFFRGGGRVASLRLEMKPIEMDASITQFLLDVDGQIVRYSHGPQVPQPVTWPGTRGSMQVRLQVSPPASGSASGLVFEGPWALFRTFDRVSFENTPQPEKFKVTFNVDGRRAVFEVLTSSVQNPFRMRELEQFQCPSRL